MRGGKRQRPELTHSSFMLDYIYNISADCQGHIFANLLEYGPFIILVFMFWQ